MSDFTKFPWPGPVVSYVQSLFLPRIPIITGRGVPTAILAKGSVYLRLDGGVGSTMYVTQGAGVWNAVAGV